MNAVLRSRQRSVAARHAERTDALVICNDDSLLIELGPLLGDHYRVHAVDTLAGIGGQTHLARWIGIVDADSLVGARGAVSRLETRYPTCPLIVITARPDDWADSIARGTVVAAVGRGQLVTARLSEALGAAQSRLRADGAAAPDATPPSATPDPPEVSPRRRGAVWAGAAGLLVVLGATAIGLYHRHAPSVHSGVSRTNGASAAAAEAGAAADQRARRGEDADAARTTLAASPQNVLELLSAARVAFRDQRALPAPSGDELRGDSALELYIQVLSQDPQNDEALAGVQRLLVMGRERITADVAGGKLDDADRLLSLLRAARVQAADLQPLASAISAARPKVLAQLAAQNIDAGDFKTAEQLLAQASASGADAATLRTLRNQEAAKELRLQLTAMATQVARAVRAGALLPPATDNALARLIAMRSIGPSQPLTLQAQYEVQTALVQAGEQATRTAQFALAQRDLNAASQLGSFASLGYAMRQLQQAQAEAQRPAALTGAAARPVKVIAEPTPAAAVAAPAATPPPPPPYIAAQPRGSLPLIYPAGANGNGSVTVEFTLSAKGRASNVAVVQSDLAEVFNRAAMDAVRHGRYSTRQLLDGQPTRARIRVRFDTD